MTYNRFGIHNHTVYSNLRLTDAICRPDKLIAYAKEIGMKGLAFTDHESLSVVGDLLDYKWEDGFKIAYGNEIYLTETREKKQKYYHYILIAKDLVGFRQLCRLSTIAWLNMYEERRMERVPTLMEEIEMVIGENKGHLIATTACLGGFVSSEILLMEEARKKEDLESAKEHKKNIVEFVLWCKKWFPNGDFYFEVAPSTYKEQIIVNKKMVELGKAFDVKIVIGDDSHYIKKEDREIHKAFLNSKEEEREVDDFYMYSYLHTEEQCLEDLAPSIPDLYEEMCANSMEIYDKIEYYDLHHKQTMPKVEITNYPKQEKKIENCPTLEMLFNSDDIIHRNWVNQCWNKLEEIFGGEIPQEYIDRLEEEADTKHYVGTVMEDNIFMYPLTLQHYIDLFWDCGSTVGAGRGSSCSGLNHYLLGVTQVDPIRWNFPWFRYLNKDRTDEMPDVDIDLCPSKRPYILKKIKEERGKNFIDGLTDIEKEELGCVLVATFGTETSKSAITTACRGYRSEDFPNGIDNDVALYLSSLVPINRGFVSSLSDTIKEVRDFRNEISKYPGLYEIARGLENLISRRSSHASGVIMANEDPYEFMAYMRTPSGDVITQWDLHKSEAMGVTKYDFLLTKNQDIICKTIEYLQEADKLPQYMTLREVYDTYFHPEKIDYDIPEVWDAIQHNKVFNLFQFDSPIGKQGITKVKPNNIDDLSATNGLIRLMTGEEGGENPIDKFVRYKKNIDLWYDEMNSWGLTPEEQELFEKYIKTTYGQGIDQEVMMLASMDEDLAHFTLKEANKLRKTIAKKKLADIPVMKEKIISQCPNERVGKYFWFSIVEPQAGYAFSRIHSGVYTIIGYQNALLNVKYGSIYWNTACLMVMSGSLPIKGSDKERNADYGKIAKAIEQSREQGIEVSLVDINNSGEYFEPEEETNRILYGLKAISYINQEIIDKIMGGRPYIGLKDFMVRCKIKKPAMINLIKAGAFDEVEKTLTSRKEIMAYYLANVSELKNRLTMQNYNGLISYGLVPPDHELQIRLYRFNKHLRKNNMKDGYYQLYDREINFLDRFLPDICKPQLSFQIWDKVYERVKAKEKKWIVENKEQLLFDLNSRIFGEAWEKYAKGTYSRWEMDSLCFYHGPHELQDINMEKYGLTRLKDLKENDICGYWKINGRQIPQFNISKICGTVIAKDDTRSSITLLTTDGTITVKFSKGHYALYKTQISVKHDDGSKTVMEKGWFKQGTMIMVQGYLMDKDNFKAKKYKRTIGHTLYRITEVKGTDISIQGERYNPEGYEEIIIEDSEY